jgi:hypothetical protein
MAPLFFTLALDGGEWSASHTSHFTLGTQWIGDWVGPRVDFGAVKEKHLLPFSGVLIDKLNMYCHGIGCQYRRGLNL